MLNMYHEELDQGKVIFDIQMAAGLDENGKRVTVIYIYREPLSIKRVNLLVDMIFLFSNFDAGV